MMSIETTGSKDRFQPGERVQGTVSWHLEAEPKSLELRLFWYTEGKGDQDVEVVNRMVLSGATGRKDFSFKLPLEPYSFSGRLISLVWALELVSDEPEETCRLEFIVSPTMEEIIL